MRNALHTFMGVAKKCAEPVLEVSFLDRSNINSNIGRKRATQQQGCLVGSKPPTSAVALVVAALHQLQMTTKAHHAVPYGQYSS